METMEEYTLNNIHLLIVPTVLIPLTMISMGISVIATFIAGLFGIKLKAEGPKRLFELLLRPKIIFSAILFNTFIYSAVWSYKYINTLPAFIFNIERINNKTAQAFPDLQYKNVLNRENYFIEENILPKNHTPHLTNQIKLPSGSFRAAAVSGESLFYGSTKGYIYEIERNSLKIKRKFYVGTFLSPAPLIWNNQLISGEGVHHTHHARIYFFNLNDGKLNRYFETKGHTEGRPVLAKFKDKELLFVVSGSDGLYALNPYDLSIQWHKNDGHGDSAVTVKNNSVFIGTGRERGNNKKYQSYALSYDFLTGKTLWKREMPASIWSKPVLTRNEVCFTYGEIYFESELGGVQCFDQKTGNPSQSYRILSAVTSNPISLNDDIIFSNKNGNICKIDTKKKTLAWCQKTHKPRGKNNFSSVIYDPFRNLLVYSSQQDGFYTLHPQTGKVLSHWLPLKSEWGMNYASPTITEEGWYLINMRGDLRFISPDKI